MKLKKVMALTATALLAVSLLTACAPKAQTPSTTPSASQAAGGKSYQLTGKYEESGENASMLSAAFLLNLNEDGTAVVDKYMFANFDASDAAANPTYTASYMSGTWKEVEKDSVLCLQIKIAYVDEAGNESNSQTAYAYDVAGVYSFDLTFPVVPGMSYTRIAPMEGAEGKTYADANAFIQANKAEFVPPESVGTFTDAEKNATAYLQGDGTMLLYAGYDKFADGKWALENGAIAVSIGGTAVDVTMDGTKASFATQRDLGNGTLTDYNFVCGDISALSAPAVSADAPYTASVDMGGNVTTAELMLNEDGTGTLKVFTDIPVTYEKVGSAVVLSTAGELEGYGAQIWPNISHAYLLNDDRSMTGIVNAYQAGDVALLLVDETNMTVQYPAYSMERDGFTYTLSADGTALTVTAPGEDVMGAFGQIWAGVGGEKWTIDGSTATKAG